MKLLHTSDLLLGQDFPHCHQVADRARASRVEALCTVLALGRKESVDAIVIAGNLWADNRVGLVLIEEVAALLSKSEVPIFLLPGQRDPITADSPYELYPDRFAGKVRVLATSDPVILKGGVTLLPFPVRKRGATGDPTRSLPDREREPLRIAVLNADRLAPGGLAKRELDYVCAGGQMSTSTEDGIHWSGAPEATDFGQQCGTVTIVELAQGKPAQLRTVPTAGLSWREESAIVSDREQLKELSDRWSRDENRSTTLLRLTLSGQLNLEGMAAVDDLRRTLDARLLYLDLRLEIVPKLDPGAFRNPLLSALTANLVQKAAQPNSDPMSEAAIAREALSLLLKTLRTSTHGDLS